MENKHAEDKAHKIHQPEFIVLDKEEEPSGYSKEREHSEYIETLQRIGKMRFSWPLRIMCVSATIIVCAATLLMALIACIALAAAALVLFTQQNLNASMSKAFNNTRKLLVVTLGLFLAVFSPPVGLGLIVLYFMMHGESINNSIFNRVFNDKN